MPVNKEKLEFRKANNLCPRDGKPNASDRKMCEHCLKKSAEKSERHRQEKRANGLCLSCGQKVDNVKFCDKCKKSVAVSSHNSHIKRYNYRKEINQCTLCNNEAVPGKTACRSCLDIKASIKKSKFDKNIHDGKCSQCGDDLGDSTGKRCQICIEKRNEWYQGSTTQTKDKTRRDENREAVLEHYGEKCVCCGETESCFLAIDHTEGDGNTHRKEIKKYGSGFFKWLVDNNFPEGFQILCHNCNMGKHLNGGVCPHQSKTIETRYVFAGKGEPAPFDLDDDLDEPRMFSGILC